MEDQCKRPNIRRGADVMIAVLLLCFQVLTNVMESDKQTAGRETPPQNWRSWKLIIDPALTKGLYTVCRFDGQRFNIPVSMFKWLPFLSTHFPAVIPT